MRTIKHIIKVSAVNAYASKAHSFMHACMPLHAYIPIILIAIDKYLSDIQGKYYNNACMHPYLTKQKELPGPGRLLGYRWMWKRINQKYMVPVSKVWYSVIVLHNDYYIHAYYECMYYIVISYTVITQGYNLLLL